MSLWADIGNKLKEVIRKMIGAKTIEQTLHVTPAISSEMEQAIELWSRMYQNKAYWMHEASENDPTTVRSLGLPAMIASEKARMVLIEFQSEITPITEEKEVENPNYTEPRTDDFGNIIPSAQPPTVMQDFPIGDTTRAEFLNKEYEKLKKKLRKQLEYGIAKGGLVIKPYVVIDDMDEDELETGTIPTGHIEFDFIQADSFYPLSFDASGNITEAAFVQTKVDKDTIYRRLEYHKWERNKVTVINKAYKSTAGQASGMNGLELGKEIPLSEVPEWADMQENTTIQNVNQPLFAYFKMPEANTIDTSSPLGVSGFDRAKDLIKDADEQYSRLLWEYEGGELAVDIDRDALRTEVDSTGRQSTMLPKLQQRLFRNVDLGSSGDTYFPYAPSLRDTSYIQGLNAILMRIEDVTGLSRGVLSDATQEARTATELKILKQRSYQTNLDIQNSLEDTLREVAYIMDVYCTLYNLVGDITISSNGKLDDSNKGQWDISFEWDDSILTDVDAELNKRLTLQQNGLASKLEVRMWYFGETEQQAKEALARIQDESMESMETDLMVQSNLNRGDE